MPWLVFNINGKDECIDLSDGHPVEIGRSPSCTVVLPEELGGSRHHCVVSCSDGLITLRDLNSTNGTYVNQVRLKVPAVLCDGDEIYAGGVILRCVTELPEELKSRLLEQEQELPFELGTMLGVFRLERLLRTTHENLLFLGCSVENGEEAAIRLSRSAVSDEQGRTFKKICARFADAPDGLLPILDCGIQDGYCWYASPYCDAPDLEKRLAFGRVMHPSDAIRITRLAAEALERGYDRYSTFHGGLEPRLFLFDSRDRLRIADFGFFAWKSVALNGGEPAAGPEYMSPEQVKGDAASWKSDQYSLGIILFRMLTGMLPFRAAEKDQLYDMQVTQPLPDPSAVNPAVAVRESLCLILKKMTAKNPNERYSAWNELVTALSGEEEAGEPEAWDFTTTVPHK